MHINYLSEQQNIKFSVKMEVKLTIKNFSSKSIFPFNV